MVKNFKKWTHEEHDFLASNLHLTFLELGQILNRHPGGVQGYCNYHGLKKETKEQVWIEYEDYYQLTVYSKINGINVIQISKNKIDLVKNYKWFAYKAPKTFYAYGAIGKRGSPIKLHQLITGEKYVDHKNGNGLDNTNENLRPCTISQNSGNSIKHRTNLTSKYKGVCKPKRWKRWNARIQGKNIGCFDTEEEAARAYDAKAIEIYGEFARLNFPKENKEEVDGGNQQY